MLTSEALLRISKEVGAPLARVETTVALLESGATVPFIARYRKEVTGNLDEVKIRDIDERRAYYEGLEERRKTVLDTIESQGKLSEELRQRILACFIRAELEDIYLPYKPKRRTKATIAREKGLEPLALLLLEQKNIAVFEEAQNYVNAEKEVNNPTEALQGARDIIAEIVSEHPLPDKSQETRDQDARSDVGREASL